MHRQQGCCCCISVYCDRFRQFGHSTVYYCVYGPGNYRKARFQYNRGSSPHQANSCHCSVSYAVGLCIPRLSRAQTKNLNTGIEFFDICSNVSQSRIKSVKTRKLSYRKDDRAMRPGALKIFGSP